MNRYDNDNKRQEGKNTHENVDREGDCLWVNMGSLFMQLDPAMECVGKVWEPLKHRASFSVGIWCNFTRSPSFHSPGGVPLHNTAAHWTPGEKEMLYEDFPSKYRFIFPPLSADASINFFRLFIAEGNCTEVPLVKYFPDYEACYCFLHAHDKNTGNSFSVTSAHAPHYPKDILWWKEIEHFMGESHYHSHDMVYLL